MTRFVQMESITNMDMAFGEIAFENHYKIDLK
jgi:hypothetical protein